MRLHLIHRKIRNYDSRDKSNIAQLEYEENL